MGLFFAEARLMKGSARQENFILYLQFERETDEAFIHLAEHLKKFNVTLLPVGLREMALMLKNQRQLLICFVDSSARMGKFNHIRAEYLDYAIQSGRIGVFFLSSFDYPGEWYSFQENGRLDSLPLPLKYEEASKKIVQFCFERFFKKKSWPGGRRSRLPIMTGSDQ